MNTKKSILYVGGAIAIIAAIFLFTQFSTFEDASWLKLNVLLCMILLASVGITMFFESKQYLLNTARIFSGILFIFSGFVKAIDPFGYKYKIIDYFEAWGMDFMIPTAIIIGLLLSTMEFVIGLLLLFKIFPKISSFFGLLFMIVFTPITLYLALQQNISGKELVHDCGCFGDALILTNWQTFTKNLLIFLPILYTFLKRKQIEPLVSKKISIMISGAFVLSVLGFSSYAIMHLPPIDFRPYKIGTKLVCEKCTGEIESNTKSFQFAEFVNKKTGERKEFDIVNNYPDYEVWDYNPDKPVRIVKEEKPQVKQTVSTQKTFEVDQMLFALKGEDYTCKIIMDSLYVVLVVQYNINETSLSNQKAINDLYDWSVKKGFQMYGASSSLDADVAEYRKRSGAKYTMLSADDIPLKTIVRANPGVVLLKNGVVINNWHYNDIPSIAEFEKLTSK